VNVGAFAGPGVGSTAVNRSRDRSRELLSQKLGETRVEAPKPWYSFRFFVADFIRALLVVAAVAIFIRLLIG
jgi:glycerol uptake facilitator-like aquaporin